MQIRPAHIDDADIISHLVHSVVSYFTIHPDGRGAEQFFDTITPLAMAQRLQSTQFQYWVALNTEQQIIGAIGIRDNTHLYHLFIAPEQHRKGYAKQLWLHAKQAALARGNPGEFTVNSSLYAEKMYRGFGFVPTAEKQEMHGLAFIPMRLLEV
ncbi:GNAT family N-acetyltransferase [Undibacterium sp. LX15W]|uniref:GNAT family N-acetyltransferase n=2 Tax=Undibacterium flavidum TaxID=2762297 RepID=A0ABR6YH54_9BURK|nr:GNAT family N-acetyltransferase [Undibacterium flavidum]